MRGLQVFIPLFFLCSVAFCQKKITISGRVLIKDKALQGAIIEFKGDDLNKKVISSEDGSFKFKDLVGKTLDTISLNAYYIGFKTKHIVIDFPQKDTIINITFNDLESSTLDEVVIYADKNHGSSAYKSTYKINSKDFISNTKGDKVLSAIPSVSIQNEEIIIDGRNKAIVFIDGIEANNHELKGLTSDDIDKVEIIANPSASYNSDFTGSVINVILKRKTIDYFKGSLSAGIGTRNNYYSTFPMLAIKFKKIIFSTYYSRIYNSQDIQSNLNRINADNSFYIQESNRIPSGYQRSLNTKMSFAINDKSKLNLSNDFSGYNFIANTIGNYSSSDTNGKLDFTNENSLEKQNRWSISSVYNYTFNNRNSFFLKSKFFKYNNIDNYNITNDRENPRIGNVSSSTNEITGEIDYSLSGANTFSKQSDIYSGIKYIKRQFDFNSNNFKVNQNVFNLFSEINTNFSKKISTMLGLSFERTDNTFGNVNQSYYYLLPTFNVLYNLGKNYSIKLGYSRKIVRPSANNLNNELIYINPGSAKQGNKDLLPQIRDYSSASLIKKINKDQISIKLYNESVSNLIIEAFRNENNILISKVENTAKYKSIGFNVGVTINLSKTINANFNTGLDYNEFSNNSSNSLVKFNNGLTFRSNINLTSKIIHEKLGLSLYGFYNGPTYTLNTQSNLNPYLGIDAETNFFKDALNIRLSYSDMFALSATRNEYSRSDNFYQTIFIRNNTSNLLLSITYYFGKKFNSNISNSTIENNDIIIK